MYSLTLSYFILILYNEITDGAEVTHYSDLAKFIYHELSNIFFKPDIILLLSVSFMFNVCDLFE